MLFRFFLLLSMALGICEAADAQEVKGPGRFCGFSPIIDLAIGESVTTLEGGIHGGSFRWDGPFGRLQVKGIGWASKPIGRVATKSNASGNVRYQEMRQKNEYVVAIWNRGHGAAYFTSDRHLTPNQIAAIDRVDLFEEGGPEPEGCKLRTVFVWE